MREKNNMSRGKIPAPPPPPDIKWSVPNDQPIWLMHPYQMVALYAGISLLLCFIDFMKNLPT